LLPTTLTLASLLTAGYTASYLLLCAVAPFGRCRHCHGTGKRSTRLTRRLPKLCHHCDATGRRVRLGRRLFEHIRAEYRDGTR
jgi:hypothetical protein